MAKKNTDFSEKKAEVLELLNKIAVLTKGIKEPAYTHDYDSGDKQYYTTDSYEFEDSETGEVENSEGETVKKDDINDDQVYLYCVGQYVERALNGDSGDVATNETKYYSSACW